MNSRLRTYTIVLPVPPKRKAPIFQYHAVYVTVRLVYVDSKLKLLATGVYGTLLSNDLQSNTSPCQAA